MNNKGQMVAVGGFIMLAIAVIVGAILLQASAQNVGTVTNTNIVNQSIATIVNGTPQYITNYKAINSLVIYNESGNVVVGSGNYTATNNVIYNGALAVEILPEASDEYKNAWVVTGIGEPLTYGDSGGRSMASLIVIMMALALLSVAVVYAVKGYQGN